MLGLSPAKLVGCADTQNCRGVQGLLVELEQLFSPLSLQPMRMPVNLREQLFIPAVCARLPCRLYEPQHGHLAGSCILGVDPARSCIGVVHWRPRRKSETTRPADPVARLPLHVPGRNWSAPRLVAAELDGADLGPSHGGPRVAWSPSSLQRMQPVGWMLLNHWGHMQRHGRTHTCATLNASRTTCMQCARALASLMCLAARTLCAYGLHTPIRGQHMHSHHLTAALPVPQAA